MHERFQAFVTGITACYRHIQHIKSFEMEEFGLKGTHVMCLYYLKYSDDGLTAADLCRVCAEDKAAISRAATTLQQKGFVTSGERKYRAKLKLTAEGLAVAERIDGMITQWVSLGGDGLSDEERGVFYRSLELITRNLGKGITQKTD